MRRYTRTPLLKFDSNQEDLTQSLSAVVFVGDQLWVASDELTSVERLSTADGLIFDKHTTFPLEKLISLPALGTKFDQEVDIEGMDYDGSYLWVVGSHSSKRKKAESKKPDEHNDPAKMIEKLAKTDEEGNRFILARIPLTKNAGGEQVLSPTATDAAGQSLKAGQLPGDVKSNALMKALKEGDGGGKGDPHLSRFLTVPGKDNGLDIEGLAVAGDKIFLGLRGPVLRGWAVVLEISVETDAAGQLSLKGVGPKGRPYKKHFLELAGLGVRDLCTDGKDLLILAGPTMNLDGPTGIYRWSGALLVSDESLVRRDKLPRIIEIPHGVGSDHAEGMTFIQGVGQPKQILVVYDSPSDQKLEGTDAVRADVFDIPAT